MSNKKALIDSIVKEEALLARLDSVREQSLSRLKILKHRLAAMEAACAIQRIFAALVVDEQRNALMLADVRRAIQEGRSPVLLTERKEHLDILADSLRSEVNHLIVLSGRLSAKERRETMARIRRQAPPGASGKTSRQGARLYRCKCAQAFTYV